MSAPRTDGCFVMADADGLWAYLRFFSDGLVLSISSDQPPTRFATQLLPGNPNFSYGRADHVDGAVRFTTTNDEGAVSFAVTPIDDNYLAVHSWSHVNGLAFDDVYSYFPG